MKPWRDLQLIAMPPRMAMLPRDPRGYPIPVIVKVENGVPDFRVLDTEKSVKLLTARCCHLCGEPMGSFTAFVGGPRSVEYRVFTDGPMHRDCAEFALQVCPFLAAPRFAYSRAEGDHHVVQGMSTERPEVFHLMITRKGYQFGHHVSGDLLIRAGEWHSVDRWKHGVKL